VFDKLFVAPVSAELAVALTVNLSTTIGGELLRHSVFPFGTVLVTIDFRDSLRPLSVSEDGFCGA
jgi:hypothetical protein